MAKQNNHARTKRKLKMLRLKAFWKRVFEKRQEKKMKQLTPKGHPFTGVAKKAAPHASILFPDGYGFLFARGEAQAPSSQRKRRKTQRQMNGWTK